VLGLLPARYPPGLPIRKKIVGVNQILAHASLGDRAKFLDVDASFVDDAGFEVRQYYESDGLHLSPEGYAKLASLLQPSMSQMLRQ
jgi:lysophospholipase L1-like esterase